MMCRSLIPLLLVPFFLVGCNEDEKPAMQGAMPVKVGAPIVQTLSEWDEFTGRFQARDRVEVRARVSGYLDAVKFADGQRVKKGDVLFIIDPRPFKIALDSAEAEFKLAQRVYARAKGLRASKAVSQQELETAEQQYRSAKAALDAAKLNMEFTAVRAPIAGRVSRHLVDVGNVVSGGDVNATVLTTVVSVDPIDFYFEASELELLKYTRLEKSGARESARTKQHPVFIKLTDEQDFIHKGKIDFVDNELDRSTGTLQARATVPNADGALTPGVFGRLRMTGSGEYEAMLVPDDVIGTNQTQKFVYVVNEKNILEPHPVTLGPLHDGGLRIIRDGLKPDDKVVMAGVTMLRPGMPVTPMPMDGGAPEVAADAAADKKAPEEEEK
jgi:RND family efflux transporter MFP subunit